MGGGGSGVRSQPGVSAIHTHADASPTVAALNALWWFATEPGLPEAALAAAKTACGPEV